MRGAEAVVGAAEGTVKECQAWALGVDGERVARSGLSLNTRDFFVGGLFGGGKPIAFPARYG